MSAPEDKYRVGATANFIDKNDKLTITTTISESLENEKMAYRLEGDYEGIISHSLESVETGTKLTYAADAEFRSTFMKIMFKLFRRFGEKELERSLEKLKSILEK